jgi:DNA-binding protein HU-beta
LEVTQKKEESGTMEKPMTKSQIIAALAEKADITKAQAKAVLEGLAELAYEGAEVGFTIPGIGKLIKQNRAARKGRNPQTGEEIDIPAKTVLKFRIAKAAKDAVL